MNIENIDKVKSKIPFGVTIIAVTKTHPLAVIQSAVGSGFLHIGENRVDEAADKIARFQKEQKDHVCWHMIGHVQSRKVPSAVRLFDRIDSVDTESLLQRIAAQAQLIQKNMHILLEVNLSGEPSKFGFDLSGWSGEPEKLQAFCRVVRGSILLPYVTVDGLMTMSPYTTDAETNRSYFRDMALLMKTVRTQIPDFGPVLSMGTSCDWQVAIQEGATELRLGEALFGPRSV